MIKIIGNFIFFLRKKLLKIQRFLYVLWEIILEKEIKMPNHWRARFLDRLLYDLTGGYNRLNDEAPLIAWVKRFTYDSVRVN